MRSLSLIASVVVLLSLLFSPSSAQNANPAAVATAADAVVLNFALTLERLDSTFFTCYLYPLNTTNPYCSYASVPYAFSQQDFANAGYNATIYQAVQLLALEELTHAAILNSTLQGLGFQPVPTCQYQYGNISTVAAYLTQGLAFESTGTAAYAGGLNGVSTPGLVQASATIATVEARHASFLSNLLGQQPFASNGLNPIYNGSQVAAIITHYYVNPTCLQQTQLPTVRPYGVTGENATDPTPYTGSQVASSGFTYSAQARANDLKTLNYALVLEDLEATFYSLAGNAFTPAQFTAAGYSATVPQYLSIIAANEATHVALLTSAITAYGGVPVSNCTYNFSALGFNAFSSIGNYLSYASTLEGTGVQAYDGAANTLTDTYLLQTAGAIALIEARHVAFINTILYPNNQSLAFPSAVDSTMTSAQVWQAIVSLGLVTSCPFVNVNDQNAISSLLPLVATPYPTVTSNTSSSTGMVTTATTFSNYSSTGYNGAAAMTTVSSTLAIGLAAIAVFALAL